MSRPRTHEQRLLASSSALLARALRETASPPTAATEVLEAAVCAHHGWCLDDFHGAFPEPRTLTGEAATLWGEKLLDQLGDAAIPLPLAVAALAQPALERGGQRKAGAYYTDFRLARYVASQFTGTFSCDRRVIDLASGSGMLLAALTLAVSHGDRGAASDFVANAVCAADLHGQALTATRTALAAAVDDLDAVRCLEPRLLVGDSLMRTAGEWEQVARGGFAAVVGNPPWEKLKVTRHELLTAAGVERHYGASYDSASSEHLTADYDNSRRAMLDYVESLGATRQLQGSGEADLYKLFLELGLRVLRPGGQLGLLVPAGLIRSQGTRALREHLAEHCPEAAVTVFENRASFFAIDSRFKFLSLHVRVGTSGGAPLSLRHGTGTATGVDVTEDVRVSRSALRRARADLTIPEVRTTAEWQLFQRMTDRGTTLDAPEWAHTYMRELDMTNDRNLFESACSPDAAALVEGRMVHQHRVTAKAHVSGTGRAAVWKPMTYAGARLAPQFWVRRSHLPEPLLRRVDTPRAGFCDVTGQTNERTLLAAAVPAGVVCGNKVPTLTFDIPGVDAETAALAWVAVANSLPVDWAARRVVTTTVNYFLLRSLPMPRLSRAELTALAAAARCLRDAEGPGAPARNLAEVRAAIDASVAVAFGLTVDDVRHMFEDFRLLDRGQPPLTGELHSTATRDLVLATLERRLGHLSGDSQGRSDRAREVGAVAFVPADYAGITQD